MQAMIDCLTNRALKLDTIWHQMTHHTFSSFSNEMALLKNQWSISAQNYSVENQVQNKQLCFSKWFWKHNSIFKCHFLSSLAWNELKVEIEYTSAESWRDKSLLWTHQEMQEVGRRLAETQKVLTFEIINETSHELPASKNWICFSQSQSSMLAYKCNGSIYANFRPFFICPVLLSLSSLVVLHNLMRNCSKSCPE